MGYVEELGLPVEMQHADGIDFVSTSHDFLEDAMNVLQTLSSPNTVCCATQTRRRGRTCLKDRIGRTTILLLHSWGKSKMCIAGDATSQFSLLVHVWSVFRSHRITRTEDPGVTQRGQGVECYTERSGCGVLHREVRPALLYGSGHGV